MNITTSENEVCVYGQNSCVSFNISTRECGISVSDLSTGEAIDAMDTDDLSRTDIKNLIAALEQLLQR